jgi:hypothetical protein
MQSPLAVLLLAALAATSLSSSFATATTQSIIHLHLLSARTRVADGSVARHINGSSGVYHCGAVNTSALHVRNLAKTLSIVE